MTGTVAPTGDGVAARIGWIDTARGMTMYMVVLLHADVVSQQIGRMDLPVLLAGHVLYPLRMPMFFLIAGLLAGGLLRRPAGEVLERRVLYYGWLYLAWLALYDLVHTSLLAPIGSAPLRSYYNATEDIGDALRISFNNVWFLYALGLFYALALLIRRLPPLAQGGIAAILMLPGLFAWGEGIGIPVLDRFLHFSYFIAGLLAPRAIRSTVPDLAKGPVIALLALFWLGSAAVLHMADWLREPIAVALLSLLAVPCGLGFAAWLTARAPRLAAPLQVVGRDTLPIYVLHTITLRLILGLLPQPGWLPGFVYQPLAALAALLGAMALGRLLQPIPGLFALPFSRPRDRLFPAPAICVSAVRPSDNR